MAQITYKDFNEVFGIQIFKENPDHSFFKFLRQNLISNAISYMGNEYAKYLLIVEDKELYVNEEFSVLFIKMLQSINLTLQDVLVVTFNDLNADDNCILNNLFHECLSLCTPKATLMLGTNLSAKIDFTTCTHEIIKTFGVGELIKEPSYKKPAYHALLQFKDLCKLD